MLADLNNRSTARSSRLAERMKLRGNGLGQHHTEGVTSPRLRMLRASEHGCRRLDRLSRRRGSRSSGVFGRHPTAKGSGRWWGRPAPEPLASFFDQGRGFSRSTLPSSREAPPGLRLAPARPRVGCGAGGEGSAAAEHAVALRSFSKSFSGAGPCASSAAQPESQVGRAVAITSEGNGTGAAATKPVSRRTGKCGRFGAPSVAEVALSPHRESRRWVGPASFG